jgi:hypothetical protein
MSGTTTAPTPLRCNGRQQQSVDVSVDSGSSLLASTSTEMDGPRILPETNVALFDLTEAFRHAIKLGLRSDEYQDDPDSFELHFLPSRSHSPRTPVEPYRMSLTSSLTSSSLGVEKLQQEQQQQKQQEQQQPQQQQPQQQQPEMRIIDWCMTLQNGNIVHKSSLDGMDLASLDDRDRSTSSSMGLPLPTRRSSSSSLLLPSPPPQHDQSHEDF